MYSQPTNGNTVISEPLGARISFDLNRRVWVMVRSKCSGFQDLPPIQGSFLINATALAIAANDFGNLIHRTPIAVLRPASVNDVVTVISFAREHGLRIAARGNGHTTFGQSQIEAGIVIDMSSLRKIHQIAPCYALVDAGVVWRDLLRATIAVGLTPPVLTDYTGLTVGGTLSVGGVSGRSFRYGAQVDQVLELLVITGECELVRCSADENSELFYGVLAGLGLCGIIIQATLKLIPAYERARTFRLIYHDALTMQSDLRHLAERGYFDSIRGNGVLLPTSATTDEQLTSSGKQENTASFRFFIEATLFHSDGYELPNYLLDSLQFIGGMEQVEDQAYFDFTEIVVQRVEALDAAGLGHLSHPWLDLLVADRELHQFVFHTIASLEYASILPGSLMLLFYPLVKSRLTCPLFRTPDEDLFFLFDILRTLLPDPTFVKAVLAQNRALYDDSRKRGGTIYPISAVPMDHTAWEQHFGPYWMTVQANRRQFNSRNILGAGLNVWDESAL